MIMKGCDDEVRGGCTVGPVELVGFGSVNGRWCYCGDNYCNSSSRIRNHILLLLFAAVILFMVNQ